MLLVVGRGMWWSVEVDDIDIVGREISSVLFFEGSL